MYSKIAFSPERGTPTGAADETVGVKHPGSRRSSRRVLPLLLWAVMLTCACAFTPRKTITGAQAIARLEEYLAAAIEAAPPSARITCTKTDDTDSGGCSKSSFYDDFTGQVQVTVTYETQEIPWETAGRYLDALAQLWGDEFAQVDRSGNHVGARTGEDGFVLYGNFRPGTRRLSVSGNSGCIWVNGTPGPDDNP